MAEAPFPPLELANRVGSLEGADDPFAWYDSLGKQTKDKILEVLPDGWSFEGKRIYDFGCGAGRTLRHFLEEAKASDFHGSDIDAASVEWLDETLSPPFKVFVNGVRPPLPFERASVDLVYCISVFTHLTDTWAAWLLELHRILVDGGIAIVTFIGSGTSRWITDEPWDEERIGMNVLKPGQSFDVGGPMVLHSPWWIRAHWGRAFEIFELQPCGLGAEPPDGQGVVAMRKRDVALDADDLVATEPDEPRELKAAVHQAGQLTRELVELRREHDHLADAWRGERGKCEELARHVAELEASSARISTSRSWRLTAPLRALGGWRNRRADGETEG